MRSAIAGLMRSALWWVATLVMLVSQAGIALSQTPSQAIYGPFSVTLPGSSFFS